MSRKVLVLNGDKKESQELCSLLEQDDYDPVTLQRKEDLEKWLPDLICLAVIVDVDSIPLDNREIRELTLKFPDICFLCTSRDRFHPELKDAICYHIYACINKPVDPDELYYWLRCIRETEDDTRDPPRDPLKP